MIVIRSATAADASALLAIYAPYVEKTGITFELEVPSVDDFRHRIVKTLERFPYLVATDESGDIIGYSYAGTLRPRPAYNHCVEVSIYIREDCRRGGIGRFDRCFISEIGRVGCELCRRTRRSSCGFTLSLSISNITEQGNKNVVVFIIGDVLSRICRRFDFNRK